MKILLINNNYPSKEAPNQATYIRSIKECLELAEFDIELLVMPAKASLFQKIISYIKFHIKLLLFNYSSYDYIYINH